MTEPDWLGPETPIVADDGHTLDVSGEFKQGLPVVAYIHDQTEDEFLLKLDSDEAGKLALRLMDFLDYYSLNFEEHVLGLHGKMEVYRVGETTARVRHQYAVQTYGETYVNLRPEEQKIVDTLIKKDQKIKELERKLEDVE